MSKITVEYALTYADGSVWEEDDRESAEAQKQYADKIVAEKRDGWEDWTGARIITRTVTVSDWSDSRPSTMVRVEGTDVHGDGFGFDMVHYLDEAEFDLEPRAREAFTAYGINVDEYKINI